MNNKPNYALIWKECGENSELARRFYVPGFGGYLPFFLEGNDLKAFENKDHIELGEEHLLKGILYGMWEFEYGTKPWHTEEGRKTLLYLLDVLGNGFKFPSLEEMILNVASNLRLAHGNTASCQVLEGGLKLIPASSKIKSDMICDLWNMTVAEQELEEDEVVLDDVQEGMLDQILRLIEEVNMQDIKPAPREIISFLGAYALALLRRPDKFPEYFVDYILPNVRNKVLIEKMNEAFRTPEKAALLPIEKLV